MKKQTKQKTGRVEDLIHTTNLIFCSFFGIGFIYSEDGLFQRLGFLFLFWTIFYVIYNRSDDKKYCKKCKRKTNHIKRGFGSIGGLSGNGRMECLECDSVREKLN